MTDFEKKVLAIQSEPLKASGIKILQLNLGYKCNMTCKHCHIDAGPARNEMMKKDVIDSALKIIREHEIETLDLTGGAPELHPHMKYSITEAKKAGRHVIVRSNLTVFYEKGKEDFSRFYSDNNVEVVASLPYYREENVDRVRGPGTFQKNVTALRGLNALGYGKTVEKQLHLVYNPMGAFLPSSQKELEEQYRKEMMERFGIIFNRLYTFANMPLGRFKDFLKQSGNLNKYMERIKYAFNPDTIDGLMCRYLISVGYDGTLYDCDFNQVLGLPVDKHSSQHIREFDYSSLTGRKISTGDHCFVCTAGQGST